jgi:hypothetical protein
MTMMLRGPSKGIILVETYYSQVIIISGIMSAADSFVVCIRKVYSATEKQRPSVDIFDLE